MILVCNPDSLLSIKFFLPPLRPMVVHRPWLVARLMEGLAHPLTLISAPAGFGKTTLVSEWRASEAGRRYPAAWLSLDPDDNDLARFLTYLITALHPFQGSPGENALTLLKSAEPVAYPTILTSMINDLQQLSEESALILDDYHVITSPCIHEALTYLLDHMPLHFHLVILGRADPPLPLSRLRARNQLVEIRAPALRFSMEDAAAFLEDVMGLRLSTDDISILERRTEGWIAGLQLAALSLRQQEDQHAFVSAFAGDDRYVMDYLMEEVFREQPGRIQSFLLKTSLLAQLCGPLCAAVTQEADSQAILISLEQSNQFVVALDNQRTWYRYHHLLADLLRRRLHQEISSGERQKLIRRACDWYEQQGYIAEAVGQALEAADFWLAAALLERHALGMFFRAESARLQRWLKQMPEDVLMQHPLLCCLYANTIAHTGWFQAQALEETERWLTITDHLLQESPSDRGGADPHEAEALARSFLALSRAYLAQWQDVSPQEVIALAQTALEDLPLQDKMDVNVNFLRFRSGLNCNLGISYLRAGDEAKAALAFSRARQVAERAGDLLNLAASVHLECHLLRKHAHLREAIGLARDALDFVGEQGRYPPMDFSYIGRLHQVLGESLLEKNDLPAAEQILEKGLELTGMPAGRDVHLQCSLAFAHLKQALGDSVGARAVMDREDRSGEASDLLSAGRARLWLSQGDLASAGKWAEGRAYADQFDFPSLVLARVQIAQIRAALLPRGKHQVTYQSLLVYLNRQLKLADPGGWLERMIELLILRAMLEEARGEMNSARGDLGQALKLAEAGGYVHLFLDEGAPMLHLLAALRPENPALQEYVDRLLEAAKASAIQRFPPEGPDMLSRRELDVLRLLASGASNREIAGQLYITLNTTKKHLTHIFMKLGVADRRSALKRARELGLVI